MENLRANELRLGNLVTEVNIGVTFIELMDLENIQNGDINYQPILLTEEWLLRLGFESEFRTSFSTIRGIDYNIFYKDNFLYNEIQQQWYWNKRTVKIDFVHQLQNLYFALTGVELILIK